MRSRALDQRRIEREEGAAARSARTNQWSGERGRRVLEDGRAQKWRCDPDGVQRRNLRKLACELRDVKSRRGVALLVLAGSDQRDRALMLAGSGVFVKAFVQLRRDRQYKSEEE